jgi:hypothetical protein
MRKSWLQGWLSGGPHFVIGREGSPYLFRWYVIPRNKFFNVYLHKFLRDDEDRALHDHPWWFLSVMVKGSYDEVTDADTARRSAPSVAFRSATHRHRVVLDRDNAGKPVPCWTLIVTGRVSRAWGFWCPKGFVPWEQFTSPTDYGQVGRGCD